MTASSIRRAGIAMVAVTLAARGIGFLREAVIAHGFGASREIDLFLVALTIPAIITTTVYYAIPNAFVPLWNSSDSQERQTIGIAFGLVLAATVLGLTLWLFAVPVARQLASGFDTELQLRTAAILKVGSATIILAVIEAILRSRLLAAKRFALTGLSYLWQSFGVIAAVLWWRDYGAMGLMWGLVAGACFSVLWNCALLFAIGTTSHQTSESTTIPIAGRLIWFWIAVVLLTDSLTQMYAIADRYLGSYLEPGAIAALNFANLTAGLPSAIIGFALSTAILPFLSDADTAHDVARSDLIIDRAIRWALVLAVPITIWLLAFRTEIAAVLFLRGAFDDNALRMTSDALAAAALGIVPVSLTAVWSRLFYASRMWLPITLTAISALLVKVALAGFFVAPLGGAGLALSTSGAYLAGAILTGFIQRRVITPNLRVWGAVAIKSATLVGIPAIAGCFIISRLAPGTLVSRSVVAFSAMAFGGLLLVVGGRRWGMAQMADVAAYFTARRA